MVLEPVQTYLPIKLGCSVDPDNITPSPGAMSDVKERPREGKSCGDGGGEEEEGGGEVAEATATAGTGTVLCNDSIDIVLTKVKRGEVPPTSTCFAVLVEGGRGEKIASTSPLDASIGRSANDETDVNSFSSGTPRPSCIILTCIFIFF